jgi:hypothetical protein
MALERKDIRAKLDADMHAALAVLCEVDQLDIGEFVERVLVRVIRERCHAATVIAERTARLGISGSSRESPGMPGNRE